MSKETQSTLFDDKEAGAPVKALASVPPPAGTDEVLDKAAEAAAQSAEPFDAGDGEYVFTDEQLVGVMSDGLKEVRGDLAKEVHDPLDEKLDRILESMAEPQKMQKRFRKLDKKEKEAWAQLRAEELRGAETPTETGWRYFRDFFTKSRPARWVIPVGKFTVVGTVIFFCGKKGVEIWTKAKYGV